MSQTQTETRQEQHQETKVEQRAIAIRTPLEFLPSNLDDAWRMSELFSKASIIPDTLRGKPHDLLIIIATGMEFGISPMVAIRELYVVKGKAYMSALLKVALVKQSSVCEYFRMVESTAEKATFETKRRGEGVSRITFTLQEARDAGLYGRETKSGEPDNWMKYPALMLRRRCASQLADEVYSDITRGAEIEDDRPREDVSRLGQTQAPAAPPRNLQVVSTKVNAPPPAQPAEDPEGLGEPTKADAAPPPSPAVEREPGSDDGGETPPPAPKDPVDELLALLAAAKTEADVDKLVVSAKTIQGPRRTEVSQKFAAKRKELKGANPQPQ